MNWAILLNHPRGLVLDEPKCLLFLISAPTELEEYFPYLEIIFPRNRKILKDRNLILRRKQFIYSYL